MAAHPRETRNTRSGAVFKELAALSSSESGCHGAESVPSFRSGLGEAVGLISRSYRGADMSCLARTGRWLDELHTSRPNREAAMSVNEFLRLRGGDEAPSGSQTGFSSNVQASPSCNKRPSKRRGRSLGARSAGECGFACGEERDSAQAQPTFVCTCICSLAACRLARHLEPYFPRITHTCEIASPPASSTQDAFSIDNTTSPTWNHPI